MKKKKKSHWASTTFTLFLAAFSALAVWKLPVINAYFGENLSLGNGLGKSGGSLLNQQAAYEPFEDYIADTIFIGDSRTVGLYTYRYVKPASVFAVVGATHVSIQSERFNVGTKKRLKIDEVVKAVQPARAVVAFGVNSIGFMNESSFFNEYQSLIEKLQAASPDTLFVVQSILPVSSAFESKNSTISNKKIDDYNQKLEELAVSLDCRFADPSDELKNSGNSLDKQYDSGDGLHYNSAAYEVLMSWWDTHRFF